jgi:D-glycero-D-manno-heptose 1,7-bisphosphate phosphatase
MAGRRGVLLDRDGVLVEEAGVPRGEPRPLPGAAVALRRLVDAGFALAVVTNQTVIARGLAHEEQVAETHLRLAAALGQPGLPFFVCPHHPSADDERYRADCACRKPRPGLLLRAADELGLDLARSVMVGDRISDVAAGARAGCLTVLLRTGAHLEAPIESPDPPEPGLQADFECDDLAAAVDWILAGAR